MRTVFFIKTDWIRFLFKTRKSCFLLQNRLPLLYCSTIIIYYHCFNCTAVSEKLLLLLKISSFSWFWAFLSKQIPKMHKITSFEDDIRNFWAKNFCPMGIPWSHWGPYLRGMCTYDLADLSFWSYWAHTVTLTQWHAKDKLKIQTWLTAWCGPFYKQN